MGVSFSLFFCIRSESLTLSLVRSVNPSQGNVHFRALVLNFIFRANSSYDCFPIKKTSHALREMVGILPLSEMFTYTFVTGTEVPYIEDYTEPPRAIVGLEDGLPTTEKAEDREL